MGHRLEGGDWSLAAEVPTGYHSDDTNMSCDIFQG